MSDTCKYNCSAHPTEINAYGDISGIGVTVAFFVTAWIIVLLLIGYYLVVYNPELDPFRKPGKKTLCQHPNAADYVFLYAFRKLPHPHWFRSSDWSQHSRRESTLNKCVIMYSDIQIFTGLAIMISGYIALSCGLQSYHWQLTVYLVWLSSLTHLAALSFLRNHLANHPHQLVWRIIAMFIIMVLLEVAVGLAGHFNWSEGPSNPSDFAICYFREKMDTVSVAFETMLKTLILLMYGFFIRLAKMSKRFEGGLRGVAARLSAKATRPRPRVVENFPPPDSQGSSSRRPSVFLQAARYSSVECYILLSIHLNLFTSFLAEVYWLILSASWVTRRFIKIRQLGSKEENEWTFGQILPLLLVLAPLATVLEHFLPGQASSKIQSQSPDRIALSTWNQSETDEARVDAQSESLNQPDTGETQAEAQDEARDNVRVDMDHQHIHSIAYRGAFFLAAVAYIEVGIFFVSDQAPGILGPFNRLLLPFFIFNPLLQFLWVWCTLWIPHMNGNNLTKTAVHGIVLTALTAISLNEFMGSLIEETKGLHLIFTTSAFVLNGIVGSCVFPVLPLRNCIAFRGPRPPWIKLFSILLFLCLAALAAVIPIISGWGSPKEFLWTLGVCICLEIAWYVFEFLMGWMDVALKWAAFLRCMSLLCILSALGVLRYRLQVAPSSRVLLPAVTVSGIIWIFVGIIASVIGKWQTTTDGDNAPSSN